MILIAHVFHVSNDISYIAGVKRHNFNFDFPCYFDLYVGEKFVEKLKIEGVVLNNNYTIDEYFDKITVSVQGHLSKDLINDKTDAYLVISKE